MWILKFKTVHRGCVSSNITKKHDVTVFSYPLGYYKFGKNYYYKTLSTIIGDERNVRRYVT